MSSFAVAGLTTVRETSERGDCITVLYDSYLTVALLFSVPRLIAATTASLSDVAGETKWRIDRLFVHPNHRRKGTGRYVIERLIDGARMHCPTAALVVTPGGPESEALRSFYQKLGFGGCGLMSREV